MSNGQGACNPSSETASGVSFVPPVYDAGDTGIADAGADHTVPADGSHESSDATIDDSAAAADASRALDGGR